MPAVTGTALGDFGMWLTKEYFDTFPGPWLGVKKSTVIIRLTLFNWNCQLELSLAIQIGTEETKDYFDTFPGPGLV